MTSHEAKSLLMSVDANVMKFRIYIQHVRFCCYCHKYAQKVLVPRLKSQANLLVFSSMYFFFADYYLRAKKFTGIKISSASKKKIFILFAYKNKKFPILFDKGVDWGIK